MSDNACYVCGKTNTLDGGPICPGCCDRLFNVKDINDARFIIKEKGDRQ